MSMALIMCFFFFFQAEDGIRDYKVTGVQTCALPIWRARCVRRDQAPCGASACSTPRLIWSRSMDSNRALKDRKSTRLNSSHLVISYAVFCLKKKKKNEDHIYILNKAYKQ